MDPSALRVEPEFPNDECEKGRIDGEGRDLAFRLAYEGVEKGIEGQRVDLRTVRNQASIVATVNGLVATFFSGFILKVIELRNSADSFDAYLAFLGLSAAPLLALACFFASLVLSLLILLPNKGWNFDISAEKIIAAFENDKAIGQSEVYKRLAGNRASHFDSNEDLLADVQNKLLWASMLTVAQAASWLFSLI